MALNFEKYAQEGSSFIKLLAKNLGHPDEIGRTGIILRAVLHTLRERITIGESLNMLSQLPMFLKGIYVDNWEYRDKPLGIKTREDFINEVLAHQNQYGERKFDWDMTTEEIIRTVLSTLGKYVSKDEAENIMSQLPKEIRELFREQVHH